MEVKEAMAPITQPVFFSRQHIQNSVSYFGTYQEHSVLDTYFTSDYDLSSFNSQKYGIGLSFDPLYGMARFKSIFRKEKLSILKSIDFHYANYNRSDGLKANAYSISLKWRITR